MKQRLYDEGPARLSLLCNHGFVVLGKAEQHRDREATIFHFRVRMCSFPHIKLIYPLLIHLGEICSMKFFSVTLQGPGTDSSSPVLSQFFG